jgi:hypothetical protein
LLGEPALYLFTTEGQISAFLSCWALRVLSIDIYIWIRSIKKVAKDDFLVLRHLHFDWPEYW